MKYRALILEFHLHSNEQTFTKNHVQDILKRTTTSSIGKDSFLQQ